jgi:hypothetical protein
MQFDLSATGDVKYDLEGEDEDTQSPSDVLPLDDSDLVRRMEILDTLFRIPKKG